MSPLAADGVALLDRRVRTRQSAVVPQTTDFRGYRRAGPHQRGGNDIALLATRCRVDLPRRRVLLFIAVLKTDRVNV